MAVPVDLSRFIDTVEPRNTVLLFGSGSSIPSGAPSAPQLTTHLATKFNLPAEGFTLSEIASLAERTAGRRELIAAVRERFQRIRPTGGLRNLPLYDWKSLFTTNYDDLVEQCFALQTRDLVVYSSDFDFTLHGNSTATKLFKLHGTIEKDVSDGNVSRIIITDADNDKTAVYREGLYARLAADLAGSHLVVIGHSLQDVDIKQIANRVADLSSKLDGWKISLLLYTPDDNRAQLFEVRGFTVCFGVSTTSSSASRPPSCFF